MRVGCVLDDAGKKPFILTILASNFNKFSSLTQTFLVDSVVPGSYKITPDIPVAHLEVFQQSLDIMWEEADKYWPFIEAQLDYCAQTAQYYSRSSGAGVAMSNWGFAMAKLGFYHMKECCKDVPLTKASAANHFQMVKDYCSKIMFECGDNNGVSTSTHTSCGQKLMRIILQSFRFVLILINR